MACGLDCSPKRCHRARYKDRIEARLILECRRAFTCVGLVLGGGSGSSRGHDSSQELWGCHHKAVCPGSDSGDRLQRATLQIEALCSPCVRHHSHRAGLPPQLWRVLRCSSSPGAGVCVEPCHFVSDPAHVMPPFCNQHDRMARQSSSF